MPELLWLMLGVGAIFFYWNASRAAAERAEQLGREACTAAEVMWLDHSVFASGIKLRRNEDGRLGWERSFRFEYSYDGIERHTGQIILRGDALLSLIGPVKAPLTLY